MEINKELFKKIGLYLPLITIIYIIVGDCYEYFLYDNFGINIFNLTDASEVLFLFFPIAFYISFILVGVLIFVFFIRMAHRVLILYFLSIAALISGVIYAFAQYIFNNLVDVGIALIITRSLMEILALLVIMYMDRLILDKMLPNLLEHIKFFRNSFTCLAVFLFFIFIHNAAKVEALMISANLFDIKEIIKTKDQTIVTNDTIVYVGETKNFIILKNFDTSIIINKEDLIAPIKVSRKNIAKDSSILLF